MKPIKIFSLSLFLFFASKSSFAQNFDYLKAYGSKVLKERICGLVAQPDGGCVFLVAQEDSGLVNSSNGPDTLSFDTSKYIFKTSNDIAVYLVRLDHTGKVTKTKYIGNFNTRIASETFMFNWNKSAFCGDDNGNLYLTATIKGTQVVGGKSMRSSNGRVIFAKFDKNFDLIWAAQTGNSTNSVCGNIFYSSGHVYFYMRSSGNTTVGKVSYTLKAISFIHGELKPSDGSILWNKYLFHFIQTGSFSLTGIVNLKNKIYISGITYSEMVFGADTFPKGTFIVEADSVGNYKKRFAMKSKDWVGVVNLTTDGEYLYIGGHFSDSLVFGKQKIAPHYPTDRSPFNTYLKTEIFVASLSSAFQVRWFYHPNPVDTVPDMPLGYLNSVGISNGYLYYGGLVVKDLILGIDTIKTPKNKGAISQSFLFKIDNRGNVLWATSGGGTSDSTESETLAISAVAEQSVYVGGEFVRNLKFGNHSITSKKNSGWPSQDGWLTKVTDNFITRGKVSAGPYCAGDTIKVPYTKKGGFDTSNYFVAELSDEYGNFETGYRELGRIKTNKDSTIIGFLPMFKVASSKLYRIRVKSTYPRVQSYYFLDSLRLLIYSRDKADPGPAETICYGTKLKLNTYGGTKWTWSPKYQMDDSTARQPIVSPTRDTIYKLIIADSSGCGEADTAFKTIFVRQKLQAFLDFKDTSLCNNQNLSIPVTFVGGDSSYSWQWFFASKSWYPWISGEKKSLDTLNYFSQADANAAEKIALVLKDGCLSKPDTAYLTINLRKKIEIKSPSDTTLCTGNLLNYKATATGGIPKQYRYQWKDLATNSILSTTDSLKILTKKSLKIQLIVNDGCEALGDTAEFEVKVKAELEALTNLRDTTICEGKSLNYTAQATGGDSKAYKFYWVLNGKQINTTSSLTLTSALTSTLTLITTDNCSPNDTITKTITVLPSPKADFSWDLACSRTVTKFKFTGTKPNSPITSTFHWNFNNEASSTLDNPSHQFAKSGTSTSTLTLTSSNGCTDTIKKSIVIKPQAKAEFEVKDVCENQTALFTNQSQDATGYLWKFGDGQTSNLQNPKHNYSISTTTTYNVTLVAQVLNGCADSISKALTINENPSSDFSYTYNGSKVDLKIAKGGNSYQWKFGTTDSAKTTATTYTHTIKSSDQHTVCLTATDLSGCSSQTCKNVTVGILKLSEKSFKIFPNPNNGSFTVELDNPEIDAAIEVYDVMSKLVKKVERVEKVTLVDLEVASGIYLVKVKNGGVVWMRKILVSFGVDTNR
jgi:PKD repeat protein